MCTPSLWLRIRARTDGQTKKSGASRSCPVRFPPGRQKTLGFLYVVSPGGPQSLKNHVFFQRVWASGGNLTGQEREAPLLPTSLVRERLVEAAEEEDKEGAVRVVCASV